MAHYDFDTEGNAITDDFSGSVKGKSFLVTGPSLGGLGAETSISLAHGRPYMIILLGRSLQKIQPVIDTIKSFSPETLVKFIAVSLDSLSSVRDAAQKILEDEEIKKIDTLINNAAIMACPYSKTVDGFESQFATNYLSHFVLTNLLVPKLRKARKPRVVNLSSWGHLRSGIRFGDLDFGDGEKYDVWESYGQAKTAIILFSVSLNKHGIQSFAVHPGSIKSGLQKYMTDNIAEEGLKGLLDLGLEMPRRKTLQQGVATTLRAALDPDLEVVVMGGKSWVYLSDCQIVRDERLVRGDALSGEAAGRLWAISEEMVEQKFAWEWEKDGQN